jgi:hypothetical protein
LFGRGLFFFYTMSLQARLVALGVKSYAAYLRSKHWQDFRTRYRQSGLPQCCAVCDGAKVSLHHVNYNRLGHEELSDVVPLCRGHHKAVHALLSEGKFGVGHTQWIIAKLRGEFVRIPPSKGNWRMHRERSKAKIKRQRKEKRAPFDQRMASDPEFKQLVTEFKALGGNHTTALIQDVAAMKKRIARRPQIEEDRRRSALNLEKQRAKANV